MIYLHKILPLLISPFFICLLLLVMGLKTRRQAVAWGAVVLLTISSLPLTARLLWERLEGGYKVAALNDARNTDAIVVLSGMLMDVQGVHGQVTEWGDPDRFFAGMELLKAGKAPTIIFTGGQLPWSQSTETEGQILAGWAKKFGIAPDSIRITGPVQNTQDEALAVAGMKGFQHVTLVTSAFHMQRAKALFEAQGLEIQAFPVDSRVGLEASTPMDFIPSAKALYRTSEALREFLGRARYALNS